MNPIMIKAVIVSILAIAGGLSGFAAVTYYNSASTSYNIDTFVPANSTFVAHVNSGSTSVIAFSANNSFGLALSVDYTSFVGELNNTTASATNHSLNVSYVTSYDGFEIFALNGLNPFSLLGNTLNLSTNSSQYLYNIAFKSIPANITTIYVVPIGSQDVLLGLPASIYAGIYAAQSGNSFHYSTYISQSANVSFFLKLNSSVFSMISANITLSGTSNVTINAYVNFTSPLYVAAFIASVSIVFEKLNGTLTYHANNTMISFTAHLENISLGNLSNYMRQL